MSVFTNKEEHLIEQIYLINKQNNMNIFTNLRNNT